MGINQDNDEENRIMQGNFNKVRNQEENIANCNQGVIFLSNNNEIKFEYGSKSRNRVEPNFFFNRKIYFFRKNSKIALTWSKSKDNDSVINLHYIISKNNRTQLKYLLHILRILEELVKISGRKQIVTYIKNKKITPELLEKLGFLNESQNYEDLVNNLKFIKYLN